MRAGVGRVRGPAASLVRGPGEPAQRSVSSYNWSAISALDRRVPSSRQDIPFGRGQFSGPAQRDIDVLGAACSGGLTVVARLGDPLDVWEHEWG